jgi:hypothetical protein
MKFNINVSLKEGKEIEAAGSFGEEIIFELNLSVEARNYATARRITNGIFNRENIDDVTITCIED